MLVQVCASVVVCANIGVYMCKYVYVSTSVGQWVHMCGYMCAGACIFGCMYVWVQVCVWVCTSMGTCMQVWMHVSAGAVHAWMHVSVGVRKCGWLQMCVHTSMGAHECV